MKISSECLHAALRELSEKNSQACAGSMPWMLGWLEHLAGDLIEGSPVRKKNARADLKKLIGRGRCILNASNIAAELTTNRCKNCGSFRAFTGDVNCYACHTTRAYDQPNPGANHA